MSQLMIAASHKAASRNITCSNSAASYIAENTVRYGRHNADGRVDSRHSPHDSVHNSAREAHNSFTADETHTLFNLEQSGKLASEPLQRHPRVRWLDQVDEGGGLTERCLDGVADLDADAHFDAPASGLRHGSVGDMARGMALDEATHLEARYQQPHQEEQRPHGPLESLPLLRPHSHAVLQYKVWFV